jgi:hypothetical protein
VAAIAKALGALDRAEKGEFRAANAAAIASHGAQRLLIVAGPGTGKSFIFRSRIQEWVQRHPGKRIAVATFVRKLADDLRSEIALDPNISDEGKALIEVNTLHAVARSIVEQTNGSSRLPLRPYCRIIPSPWDEIVWADVFCLAADYRVNEYPWEHLKEGLYDAEIPTTGGWTHLRAEHLRLQQFYNALTFPDLILLATEVVKEHPELARETLSIFDEFQDFNLADEALIGALTAESPGLLLAGDDDQVLYQVLRRGHPRIIRRYYDDRAFANAMLPFCGRCGFHICRAAEAFLSLGRPQESIVKVFVPFHDESRASSVQVVASTSPKTGIEYIETFLDSHADAIRERQEAISRGDATEAYLLLLTPARALKFLDVDGARDRLEEILNAAIRQAGTPEDDYWRLLDYYLCGRYPGQNFLMRKVLEHEAVSGDVVCELLRQALTEEKAFIDLGDRTVSACARKCSALKEIFEADTPPQQKVDEIERIVHIGDPEILVGDLERFPIGKETSDEDRAPFERGVTSAVQLTTIVGSKGLSADHVIVLGCDNATLAHVTRNAFFVALTRARESLTLMACIGGGGAKVFHEFVGDLPDDHTRASMWKAGGVQDTYSTINDLQEHLAKWQYAKEQSARRARPGRREV